MTPNQKTILFLPGCTPSTQLSNDSLTNRATQRSAPSFEVQNTHSSPFASSSVFSVSSVVNSSAFSLVELLVVIAIIGMMVGLSTVAVQGMRAPAVQHAADQVMSGLSLARQVAITKNTHAALLIADQTSAGFPTNGPYRHWSVVYSNKGLDTWTIAKDWEELPNGAVFSQLLENARTNNSFPSGSSPGSAITGSYYPGNYTTSYTNIISGNNTFSTTSTPSIQFNSSGVAIGDGRWAGSVGIRISPGTAMSGNATITSTNQYYIIESDHAIGRIRLRSPESY